MMILEADGFDGDDKVPKRGVFTTQVEEVFPGGPLVAPDPKPSQTEGLIAIGRTRAERHVFVAFYAAS